MNPGGIEDGDFIDWGDGVTAIDTRYVRPRMDAAHLIVHGGRAAFVDCGTASCVPTLLAALGRAGLEPADVDWLFLTHVHLDHAGGAGQLMRALPNARAVLHPRGAPHMIDPAKLITASIAVYGEALYRRLYGEILPIPAERVVSSVDGQRLSLAGREFELLHTPGHALHHQAIHDLAGRTVFTGDTFGLSYRELDVDGRPTILPTTTPTQFDPGQLESSVRRLAALAPDALYLTHYSRVGDVPRLAEEMIEQLRGFTALARRHAARPDAERHAAIKTEMREQLYSRLRAQGVRLEDRELDTLLDPDLELNVAGLSAWLARATS